MKRFLCTRRSHAVPVLLRDYIQDSLYHPKTGYFSNETPPLLQHKSPVQFNRISSKSAYQDILASATRTLPGWMTPVELFSPYLSRAIANRIEQSAPRNGAINVIEIGAGRGTLAKDILHYWKDAPDLTRRLKYVTLEISDVLAKVQEEALRPWIREGKAEVLRTDALKWFGSNSFRVEGHCHVIATELLDNLPHDLIREGEALQQAEVLSVESGHRFLQWSECRDEDILSTIDTYGVMETVPPQTWRTAIQERFEFVLGGGFRYAWVPTASFRMLKAIVSSLPQAHMTLTDFDEFAGAMPGINAPVVQSVRGGATVVHDDVHSAPFGQVDIMFPTDFHSFARGHASLIGKNADFSRVVMKQRDFFQEYATRKELDNSTCLDGYNPILHDFENVSYLLVNPI